MRLHCRGFNAPFAWRVQVNVPTPGWRGWLGLQLRRLAQLVDGCHSLGIHIETTPGIGRRAEHSVIEAGIDTMERGTADLVREAAVDQALRKVYPALVEPRP